MLVLVLISIAVLGLFLWWSGREGPGPLDRVDARVPGSQAERHSAASADPRRAEGAEGDGQANRPSSNAEPGSSLLAERATHGAAANPAERARPAVPSSADSDRFRGRGRIRGSVDAGAGARFPDEWLVVLRPGLYQPGREHAIARVVPFERTGERTGEGTGQGTREFTLEDVPLGGYEVSIRAAGLNCPPVPVVLERGHTDAYVTLVLSPAGYLEGRVVEEDGTGLSGFRVVLERLPEPTLPGTESSAGAGATEPRATRTDLSGVYLFEHVLDGEYRLHFGEAEPPALPSRDLAFQAPTMHFPTLTAPQRARLELTVREQFGGPVAGADVFVEGPTGRVTLRTDAAGHATAHLLLPGPHRVTAQIDSYGSAVDELDFTAGERVEHVIELRPN